MEESLELSMLSQIHKEFGESSVDIRTYSPLTLAYIGDAVFNGCANLKSVNVAKNNPNYKSENNCIIKKSNNRVIFDANSNKY